MTFFANIYELISEWGPNLMGGLAASLQIAVGGYILGLLIGVSGALGKIYGGPVLKWSLEIYTTLIRAVPELVLILLLYFAGTQLLSQAFMAMGYGRVDISGLAAGIAVLGFVQGAYSTEVMRGAILAIPKGEVEAGASFGMGSFKIFHRIMIPAMLPLALPGLANLWLIITKDTALLAVVGYEELALVTRQAAGATRYYLEAYIVAGAIYLAVTLVSNQLFKLAENRVTRGRKSLASGGA
ncbi:octopine transport system permease protein OccQ [Ahrensia sp. R2A130]|nr:octopine transport system permease protein OccQ [Ahrensia sp. R2A130]